MDWLEHGWIFFFWIQICRRGDADRSDDRGAKIRKNVTEEIRTHNNIKPVRMPHKMGCQYIDMVLMIPLDFVAEVRCFFLRWANSKANRKTRFIPRRVKTVC